MKATPPTGSRTADYEYELPPDRIAQFPAERRESSRLMVVDRASGSIQHRAFADIVDLIAREDVLVVNETRVFPARLWGQRPGGGRAEVLLLHPVDGAPRTWAALVRPGNKLKPGRTIEIAPGLRIRVVDSTPDGSRIIEIESSLPPFEAIEKYGEVPLPPYLRRSAEGSDRERYQTVYARASGSVAAPTAGLHFSHGLMEAVARKGITVAPLVLHVGVGTFRPVEVDDPGAHRMHSEWYRVPPESAAAINEARRRGGAVWAVGTTSVRTLETVATDDRLVPPGEGWTDIFIRPPHTFRAVDRMITNFHLPRSTLMMLVAAFAGYERTMAAYQTAIAEGYRFYSYGDAMVII